MYIFVHTLVCMVCIKNVTENTVHARPRGADSDWRRRAHPAAALQTVSPRVWHLRRARAFLPHNVCFHCEREERATPGQRSRDSAPPPKLASYFLFWRRRWQLLEEIAVFPSGINFPRDDGWWPFFIGKKAQKWCKSIRTSYKYELPSKKAYF